ncbi:hypothetical protein PoB_006441400 [Plakobranchus ocellatus]|uniref:Uncharacterized protein n=1 Tax=Plakobranchus ocellatus TaxID=259542 RepID=A0AAV4D1C6_9GAST|nr:hypothetical protein PoB_006441400 [Plakobranchus ocellatus]
MAIANANYEFLYVNFGTNGRMLDGGVLGCTEFHNKLKQGTLNLPLTSDNDPPFALREDFLKPSSRHGKSRDSRNTSRLSDWRINIAPLVARQSRNSSEGAQRVRDLFADLFNNNGSVPKQIGWCI